MDWLVLISTAYGYTPFHSLHLQLALQCTALAFEPSLAAKGSVCTLPFSAQSLSHPVSERNSYNRVSVKTLGFTLIPFSFQAITKLAFPPHMKKPLSHSSVPRLQNTRRFPSTPPLDLPPVVHERPPLASLPLHFTRGTNNHPPHPIRLATALPRPNLVQPPCDQHENARTNRNDADKACHVRATAPSRPTPPKPL